MFTRAALGNTKAVGDDAESRALAWLLQQGLVLVRRNYRVARGPHARGGEIDLIMRDHEREGQANGEAVLVFIEVRARSDARHGGAAASVSATKRARIVRTAQHYLMSLPSLPPCRFDVVAVQGDVIEWLRGAFDSS